VKVLLDVGKADTTITNNLSQTSFDVAKGDAVKALLAPAREGLPYFFPVCSPS